MNTPIPKFPRVRFVVQTVITNPDGKDGTVSMVHETTMANSKTHIASKLVGVVESITKIKHEIDAGKVKLIELVIPKQAAPTAS